MRLTRKKKRVNTKYVYIGGNKSDKCVFVDLQSNIQGLGNQLFIYSAGLIVKNKTGLPLCLVSLKGNPHTTKDYRELMDGNPVDLGEVNFRMKLAKVVLSHVPENFGEWANTNIHYNSSKNTGDIKIKHTLYQNYKSIHKVIPEVKDMLIKHEFHKEHYDRFRSMIQSAKSAFMHVRRGDYIQYGWELSVNYYCKALDLLDKNSEIEIIYVFSNELDWCKKHDSEWKKHTQKQIIYSEHMNELETLYSMMLCEAGAIISNSTFSAWGAMMGADTKSSNYIVYPSPWGCNWGSAKNPLSFSQRWIGISK